MWSARRFMHCTPQEVDSSNVHRRLLEEVGSYRAAAAAQAELAARAELNRAMREEESRAEKPSPLEAYLELLAASEEADVREGLVGMGSAPDVPKLFRCNGRVLRMAQNLRVSGRSNNHNFLSPYLANALVWAAGAQQAAEQAGDGEDGERDLAGQGRGDVGRQADGAGRVRFPVLAEARGHRGHRRRGPALL